jgi:general stress protein CsbA
VEFIQFSIFTAAIIIISKMVMRILAVLPTVFCTVALVLSFLCLFAGSKKGFMEDYAIVTVRP